MKTPLGLLLAVSLLVTAAGCAAKTDATGGDAAAPASSAAAEPSTSPRPSISLPAGVPKTTKGEPPVDDFQQVTAEGRVRVTGTCVELVTGQVTWTLLGPVAAGLHDGQQAKAVGVPDPNRETGCTGSPLLVSKVTPL